MDDSSSLDNGTSAVGTLLRQRREQLGQTIENVSDHLRIRAPYLRAIEAGRLGELPGIAYTIGFVRSYADYLGLDGARIVGDYRQEIANRSRANRLVFPLQAIQGKSPSLVLLLLCLLLIGGVYGGWSYWKAHTHRVAALAHVEPVPAEMLAQPSAQAPAPSSQTKDAAPPSSGLTASTAAAVPAAPPSQAETPGVTPSPAAVQQPVAATPPPAAPAPAEPSAAPAATVAAPPPASRTGIVLHARLDSWVQIRGGDGKDIFSRVLRKGEDFVVPEQEKLVMTTGNAGGLDITVDGVNLAPLGAVGFVRRDIALNRGSLRALPQARPTATSDQGEEPPADTNGADE
ncbi:MAG TPA: RodZ domain-containing protein [Dongiaceae bacterium]|jgi:cytoskeleton protein RodZ|nr:RodZ domain-containing protein [Dongiaceae bacterium]